MTETEGSDRIGWIFGALVAIVITFGLASWAVFAIFPLHLSGGFGDGFAAIGALFSALAFGGVIVAIGLQRQELRLQRRELTLTRAELAGQKAQLEAQNRTMELQVFEGCFFQMLRLNRECVSDFTAMFRGSSDHVSGAHAFRQAAAHLVEELRPVLTPEGDHAARSARVAGTFARYCLAAPSDFAHYFRNLYHVFLFIDRSGLDHEKKQHYSRIVRAQMSTAELVLLFANCQTDAGRPFTDLVTKYSIFKVARWPPELARYEDLVPEEAYGRA